MTVTVILDASAAVRAVLDAAGQPALIERIGDAASILAPTLLRAEVGNALWKYARSGLLEADELVERHREAMSLVHRFIDEDTLFPEALTVSAATGHPVYDVLYALTARRHAAVVLTFDRRLHKLCESEDIASQLFVAR